MWYHSKKRIASIIGCVFFSMIDYTTPSFGLKKPDLYYSYLTHPCFFHFVFQFFNISTFFLFSYFLCLYHLPNLKTGTRELLSNNATFHLWVIAVKIKWKELIICYSFNKILFHIISNFEPSFMIFCNKSYTLFHVAILGISTKYSRISKRDRKYLNW